MDRRLLFDEELRALLQEVLGYVNIYYEPDESTRMKYDAIVYKQMTMKIMYANDRTYNATDCYQVIAVSRDPDSPLPRAIQMRFPMCAPSTKYMSENLYHFPFTIYF